MRLIITLSGHTDKYLGTWHISTDSVSPQKSGSQSSIEEHNLKVILEKLGGKPIDEIVFRTENLFLEKFDGEYRMTNPTETSFTIPLEKIEEYKPWMPQ